MEDRFRSLFGKEKLTIFKVAQVFGATAIPEPDDRDRHGQSFQRGYAKCFVTHGREDENIKL